MNHLPITTLTPFNVNVIKFYFLYRENVTFVSIFHWHFYPFSSSSVFFTLRPFLSIFRKLKLHWSSTRNKHFLTPQNPVRDWVFIIMCSCSSVAAVKSQKPVECWLNRSQLCELGVLLTFRDARRLYFATNPVRIIIILNAGVDS